MLRLHYLTEHRDCLEELGLDYMFLYNDVIWHLFYKSKFTTRVASLD